MIKLIKWEHSTITEYGITLAYSGENVHVLDIHGSAEGILYAELYEKGKTKCKETNYAIIEDAVRTASAMNKMIFRKIYIYPCHPFFCQRSNGKNQIVKIVGNHTTITYGHISIKNRKILFTDLPVENKRLQKIFQKEQISPNTID